MITTMCGNTVNIQRIHCISIALHKVKPSGYYTAYINLYGGYGAYRLYRLITTRVQQVLEIAEV